MLWLVVVVGFIVSARVVWLMVVSFRFLFALASCFSHISILSDITLLSIDAHTILAETFSRAKRWPVVGARFIAPTGWRGGNSVQKCTHTREEIPSGCGQTLSPGSGCYLPGVPES